MEAKKLDTTLRAVVRYVPATSAKCRWATHITIYVGPVPVATRSLGGRYSQDQALVEFKRNGDRFAKLEGFDALRLAA